MWGAAIVTTPGYEEHKQQRAAVYKFFQPEAIRSVETSILCTVEKLCLGVQSGGSVNLSNAYRSLTNDIVTSFYFSSSNTLIDERDYAAKFHRACGGFLRLLAVIRQFRIVGHVLTAMSAWYQKLSKPAAKLHSILQHQQV